jgi:SAM-dependent methyltransferase
MFAILAAPRSHLAVQAVGLAGLTRHDGQMAAEPGWAAHWDEAFAQGDTTRSWFQAAPGMSLRMLDAAGVTPADSVIDVGGGTSPLAGALLGRGFGDVTVLDISAAAMEHARRRLGPRADQVHWLAADIRVWRPARRFAAWHDRAAFHFLTAEPDRRDYRRALAEATAPGAVAVVGCFAPDGPQHCSGLPVARYGPGDLAAELGPDWEPVAQDREEHTTPAGQAQPFTWVALRRTR